MVTGITGEIQSRTYADLKSNDMAKHTHPELEKGIQECTQCGIRTEERVKLIIENHLPHIEGSIEKIYKKLDESANDRGELHQIATENKVNISSLHGLVWKVIVAIGCSTLLIIIGEVLTRIIK